MAFLSLFLTISLHWTLWHSPTSLPVNDASVELVVLPSGSGGGQEESWLEWRLRYPTKTPSTKLTVSDSRAFPWLLALPFYPSKMM